MKQLALILSFLCAWIAGYGLARPAATPGTQQGRQSSGIHLTLLHMLRGHTAPIGISAAFSPAGNLVAASGEDGTVRVWRMTDGVLIRTLNGHTNGANACAAFTSDGKLLVAAGANGDVRVWNVLDWTLRRSIPGGSPPLALSPSGRIVAAVGPSGDVVHLWDVRTGTRLRSIEGNWRGGRTGSSPEPTGNSGHVEAIVFAPDGRHIAIAGASGTVALWRVSTGAQDRTLGKHLSTVRSLAFSPDGRCLASGGADRAVRLWPLRGGKPPIIPLQPEHAVALAFSPNGRALAVGTFKEFRLYQASDGAPLGSGTTQSDWISALSFSSDGRLLATASRGDQTVAVWRVK